MSDAAFFQGLFVSDFKRVPYWATILFILNIHIVIVSGDLSLNVPKIHEVIVRALQTVVLICVEKEQSVERKTPKSLTTSVDSIVSPQGVLY